LTIWQEPAKIARLFADGCIPGRQAKSGDTESDYNHI